VAVGETWVWEPLVLPLILRLRFLTGSGNFRMSLSNKEICAESASELLMFGRSNRETSVCTYPKRCRHSTRLRANPYSMRFQREATHAFDLRMLALGMQTIPMNVPGDFDREFESVTSLGCLHDGLPEWHAETW
jgi:hypothetical protein